MGGTGPTSRRGSVLRWRTAAAIRHPGNGSSAPLLDAGLQPLDPAVIDARGRTPMPPARWIPQARRILPVLALAALSLVILIAAFANMRSRTDMAVAIEAAGPNAASEPAVSGFSPGQYDLVAPVPSPSAPADIVTPAASLSPRRVVPPTRAPRPPATVAAQPADPPVPQVPGTGFLATQPPPPDPEPPPPPPDPEPPPPSPHPPTPSEPETDTVRPGPLSSTVDQLHDARGDLAGTRVW